jgi:hypothetical protein
MIKNKYRPNTQGIEEVEVTPPKMDNLFTLMKEFMREKEKMDKRPGQGKNKKAKPKQQTPKYAQQPPATPTKTKEPKKVWKVKDTLTSDFASPGPDASSAK